MLKIADNNSFWRRRGTKGSCGLWLLDSLEQLVERHEEQIHRRLKPIRKNRKILTRWLDDAKHSHITE